MTADIKRMYRDVEFLTSVYPPRNHKNYESLEEAASYIEAEFQKLDCMVENQYWEVNGHRYRNVIASFNTERKKRLIVGAHYDVFGGTPGPTTMPAPWPDCSNAPGCLTLRGRT